jgi:hypothetical protein
MKPKNKPGQGRPTLNGPRQRIDIRLPTDLISKIPIPKTKFIEAAIIAALENSSN